MDGAGLFGWSGGRPAEPRWPEKTLTAPLRPWEVPAGRWAGVEMPVGVGHLVGFTLGGVYGLSPIFPSYEETYEEKNREESIDPTQGEA